MACNCESCFYCDTPIMGRHEHDHFPRPRSVGGEHVVAACLSCHELKDRTLLFLWDPQWYFDAWSSLPREGRLLGAKILRMLWEAEALEPGVLTSPD